MGKILLRETKWVDALHLSPPQVGVYIKYLFFKGNIEAGCQMSDFSQFVIRPTPNTVFMTRISVLFY